MLARELLKYFAAKAKPNFSLFTIMESSSSEHGVAQDLQVGKKEDVAMVTEKALNNEEKDRIMKMLNERQGAARIKSEFINFDKFSMKYGDASSKRPSASNEEDKRHLEGDAEKTEPPAKKARGRNRNRRFKRKWVTIDKKLCRAIISGEECQFGDKCGYAHDLSAKGAARQPDIADRCYNFETFGKCRYGVICRFGSTHLTEDFKNIVDDEKYAASVDKSATSNGLPIDLKVKLRKKNMTYPRADKFLSQLAKSKMKKMPNDSSNGNAGPLQSASTVPSDSDQAKPSTPAQADQSSMNIHHDPTANQDCMSADETTATANEVQGGSAPVSSVAPEPAASQDSSVGETQPPPSGVVTDEDVIKLRKFEKKQLQFEGKSYLAPLTTVGNLPFRRVCKRLGADITCGEMAMSINLLQGQPSEWALLKRHSSEDMFGVQLAGYFPDTISKCSELINTYCDVDFVDLNVGCPIDLVFQKGGGSALMGRVGKFEEIVRGMDAVLDVPVTVKLRTGIQDKHHIAHNLISKIYDWGASLVTLHGRTREQRYTRSADWSYIRQCVEAAKPHPLIGNGDILSYEDVQRHLEHSGAASVMVARGALIKPWVFTEIKEQRHWDISANERLDILKEFTNYGMEHWGSDNEGVEKTRRFLLEWLSFLHRYIPVGLLEQVPQKIQERPPYYVGRNTLETLMSSANCADWVKISEMLLGPVPDTFQFLPKHKANSYS